ncbi:hypothetical protein JCM5350_008191 [Sporobolomyces pararoseus]
MLYHHAVSSVPPLSTLLAFDSLTLSLTRLFLCSTALVRSSPQSTLRPTPQVSMDPATPPEPIGSPQIPPYSLASLSPSVQTRISSSTPFRFHTPFPSSSSSSNPSFLEPFIPISSSPSSRTASTSTPPGSLELILTPPRPQDLSLQVKCLNKVSVGMNLIGPPFPYSFEMGKEWSSFRYENVSKYFKRLSKYYYYDDNEMEREEERKEKENEVRREGIPFASIRNRETGEWVGEIGICRWEFRDIEDEREREKKFRENEEREVGDDELVWSFGYYVSPKYQGKGIMTLVLSSLFESVFIDYLDAKIVRASAFADNEASIRVQEKCGLKKVMLDDGKEKRFWHEVSEGRGGGRREEVVLEWRKGP